MMFEGIGDSTAAYGADARFKKGGINLNVEVSHGCYITTLHYLYVG